MKSMPTKNPYRSILLLILLTCVTNLTNVFAQQTTVSPDTTKPETFEYTEGDTTYVMQKYFMVFLKSGPTRSQTQEEAQALQKKHMAHIKWLGEQGFVSMAGPFADDGDIRGILIFNTATLEQAERLAQQDPSVKAGRLVLEIHPWWAAKGSTLK